MAETFETKGDWVTSKKVAVATTVEVQKPNRLLWVLFASYFTFGIVLNVVGVVIPIVIRQYHLSLFAGGLLAFALYIPFGVCSIPAGLAADRFGSKPVVLAEVLLMAIGCGAIPWAANFVSITVLAFVIGAGVALLGNRWQSVG